MKVNFYVKNTARLLILAAATFASCNKESDQETSLTISSVEITGSAFESYNGSSVYVPFTVTPADYPLTKVDLFMGVYDSQVTRSTTSDYPPFTDEFGIGELIATDVAGSYLAQVNTASGNFYAEAEIAIAIRQKDSNGEYFYTLSERAKITTAPVISSDLLNFLPQTNSISLYNGSGEYNSNCFELSAALLSEESTTYYNTANMKVVADSVILSDASGKADTLDLFTIEKLDDLNWRVTPKSSIDEYIEENGFATAYIRYMATDSNSGDTVSSVASATFYPNSIEDDLEWSMEETTRFASHQVSISSYLSKLGITQSMVDSNEDIEKLLSTLTFTKANGDSIDDYCEYSLEYSEDDTDQLLPTTLNIKFYNDLPVADDYVIVMGFEYGESSQEPYICSTIQINIGVTE